MYVHEGQYKKATITATGMLEPFPVHLALSPEDKKAVLVHHACDDGVAWMQDIVKHTLRG